MTPIEKAARAVQSAMFPPHVGWNDATPGNRALYAQIAAIRRAKELPFLAREFDAVGVLLEAVGFGVKPPTPDSRTPPPPRGLR